MPILNLISKVRKLTGIAGVAMEPLLTGLPIITAYGKCVGRRSLELKPKSIMGYVKSRCCQEYKIVTVRILFDRQIKLKESEDSATVVWLCMALYGYVGLCMAMQGYVGLWRAM